MDIELKHYNLYIKKLNKFAAGLNLKIIHKDLNSEGGIYYPTLKKIHIENDLSQSMEVAILLHELGHAIDTTLKKGEGIKNLEEAYAALYQNKHTKAQIKLIRKCELRAWAYGEGIAKQLKIRIGKWYYETKKYCLKGYTI